MKDTVIFTTMDDKKVSVSLDELESAFNDAERDGEILERLIEVQWLAERCGFQEPR